MKDYLDYVLRSLIISLDCPIKKGPFSFKIGQNLKYLVKDDPQSHIVITPEFVYLGKSCQEGEYSKGVQFKGAGSAVYGLFHTEQCEFFGKGVLVFPNGNDKIVFDGEMVDGKFKGVLTFDSESNKYLNLQFDNGEFVMGSSRFSIRFDDHLNYFKIDNYKNAIYHDSKVFYFNGDVYEGEFLRGEPHGYGQLTNSDGEYEGKFQHGKFHGQGKLTKPSFEYEGEFQYGKFHGQGKLNCSNGNIKEGEFKDNELHNGESTIGGETFSVKDGVKKDVPLRRS